MKYQNFLKIAVLAIPLLSIAVQSHAENSNKPATKIIEQPIFAESTNPSTIYKSEANSVKKINAVSPRKPKKESSLKKTLKTVAFVALGIGALGTAGLGYFFYQLILAGKMNGLRTEKQARAEIADEALDIFRIKKKYKDRRS